MLVLSYRYSYCYAPTTPLPLLLLLLRQEEWYSQLDFIIRVDMYRPATKYRAPVNISNYTRFPFRPATLVMLPHSYPPEDLLRAWGAKHDPEACNRAFPAESDRERFCQDCGDGASIGLQTDVGACIIRIGVWGHYTIIIIIRKHYW